MESMIYSSDFDMDGVIADSEYFNDQSKTSHLKTSRY